MKVFSNTAISLDGRINTREGRFTTLGTARDHARMSRLRGQADAVLVGGATFRNWPHPSLPEGDDLLGLPAPFYNVIVTRSLEVPVPAELLAEPRIRPLFLTRDGVVPAGFPAEYEAYTGPGDSLPISWILQVLRRRGVQRLLIEAGGDLLFQFLEADAIDEINVTLCPLVIGGPTPSLASGRGFDFAEMPRLQLMSSEVEGDEIFLRYAVRRNDAAPQG
ncbi:MAG TPA: dihydrofolate reductase family protein [Nannocystis sp.]|jgi:riboflavin biosynthesis pyrimidine reductase